MTMPTNQCPWRMQVHHITQETPDVWTISLICHDYYPYRAGQYALVSVRNSAETLRAYTISSTPGVSEYITLTVRRIDDGVGSQWLTRDVKRGDYLWLSDAMGEFTCDDKAEDKFLLLAAGCGVTPIMSMRRWLAKNRPQADVRVIYNVRTPQDVIFADEWQEIEDFGHERLEWLKKYGDFDNGIPVDDTIARVVSNIDSLAFEKMFIEWMQECHEITDGEIIAIDGKTIRGSFDKGKRKGAIHMVSAFSNENGVVLGQVKTEAKSNEITAIPELLNLLYLMKNLITIDAMGCQKDIASKIKDKKADYLLAVKGNQGKLHHAFEEKFPVNVFSNYKGDSFSTQEISHGRKETRLHIVSNVTPELL